MVVVPARASASVPGHSADSHWPGRIDLRCLHGNQTDWFNSTVIVPAVYKEWGRGRPPPSWLRAQYPVFLYQRLNESLPCACPNRGYESGVYIQFIAEHYAHLPAYVAFVQADWIFATKTNPGKPFTFWQPECVRMAASAQPQLPWADYMPLGGRRSYWPPRCVIRQTSWYSRLVGRHNGVIIEACVRELLHILGGPVKVRPYNRSKPLNVTFYTNMNLLVSRRRIRSYEHSAWRVLAHRFVQDGTCLSPGMRANETVGQETADGTVIDSRAWGKATLGMTTELLQQSIFGLLPLENGHNPVVPQDAQHCSTASVNAHCTITS